MHKNIRHLVYLFCILSIAIYYYKYLYSKQGQDVRRRPTEVIDRKGNDWEWKYTCKSVCSTNQYVYQKQCYNTCQSHTVARDNEFIRYCVSDVVHFHCPESVCREEYPYYFDGNGLDSCPEYTVGYNVSVYVCPSRSLFEYRGKCVETCPKDRPFVNTTPANKSYIFYHQCVAKCPPDKFLWMKNKKCVTDCPDNTLLLNSTCVDVCPETFPLNYTKVRHGKHEHMCVSKCPGNTYQYKDYCFDLCPPYLKYYLSNCILECPKTYPYLLMDNDTCVQSCPDHYIYDGKKCAEKFPREHFYIENKRCVNMCSNSSAPQRQTNQGSNNTVLMEETNYCIGKCLMGLSIICNTYIPGSSCPNSHLIENSAMGTRCVKKKCSNNSYVDGKRCVYKRPSSKTKVGHKPKKKKKHKAKKFAKPRKPATQQKEPAGEKKATTLKKKAAAKTCKKKATAKIPTGPKKAKSPKKKTEAMFPRKAAAKPKKTITPKKVAFKESKNTKKEAAEQPLNPRRSSLPKRRPQPNPRRLQPNPRRRLQSSQRRPQQSPRRPQPSPSLSKRRPQPSPSPPRRRLQPTPSLPKRRPHPTPSLPKRRPQPTPSLPRRRPQPTQSLPRRTPQPRTQRLTRKHR